MKSRGGRTRWKRTNGIYYFIYLNFAHCFHSGRFVLGFTPKSIIPIEISIHYISHDLLPLFSQVILCSYTHLNNLYLEQWPTLCIRPMTLIPPSNNGPHRAHIHWHLHFLLTAFQLTPYPMTLISTLNKGPYPMPLEFPFHCVTTHALCELKDTYLDGACLLIVLFLCRRPLNFKNPALILIIVPQTLRIWISHVSPYIGVILSTMSSRLIHSGFVLGLSKKSHTNDESNLPYKSWSILNKWIKQCQLFTTKPQKTEKLNTVD